MLCVRKSGVWQPNKLLAGRPERKPGNTLGGRPRAKAAGVSQRPAEGRALEAMLGPSDSFECLVNISYTHQPVFEAGLDNHRKMLGYSVDSTRDREKKPHTGGKTEGEQEFSRNVLHH